MAASASERLEKTTKQHPAAPPSHTSVCSTPPPRLRSHRSEGGRGEIAQELRLESNNNGTDEGTEERGGGARSMGKRAGNGNRQRYQGH
jgi:hypothetical protein